MSDWGGISPFNIEQTNNESENEEKYPWDGHKLIQYQILRTNII